MIYLIYFSLKHIYIDIDIDIDLMDKINQNRHRKEGGRDRRGVKSYLLI